MSRRLHIIRSRADRDLIKRWAENVDPGTLVEFKSARRNLEQNSLMWVLLGEISKQVDWYGHKLSSEDWKDIFTASLRKCRTVPGLDYGTVVPLGMRTSDMTKAEFSDLLELIFAFGAERGLMLDVIAAA